jgi:hypothetical protein
MRTLATWSFSTVAFTTAGWIALVLVAWLFTPGGQAVIMFVELAIQEQGPLAVELPLSSMRAWGIAASCVAVAPSLS